MELLLNQQRTVLYCVLYSVVKTCSDFSCSDHVFGEKIWKWQESVDCSAIAKVFMGQFKSCVQCLTCRHVSRVFEPFWQISLSIRDCEKVYFYSAELGRTQLGYHIARNYKARNCSLITKITLGSH